MHGKVIVVTGAGGVLGQALVSQALKAGAKVGAIDQTLAQPSEEICLRQGGVNLGDPLCAQSAIDVILERFGRIDALLNAVGGFVWQTTIDGDPAAWERLYKLNVSTVLNACRSALPALITSGGSIVNVGAFGALSAAAGMGAYAASKAGVHRLTEALAEEVRDRGVRVNAVLPTILDTPSNRADMPSADFARWVAPTALAEIMIFLASDKADPITGALLPVRGGV